MTDESRRYRSRDPVAAGSIERGKATFAEVADAYWVVRGAGRPSKPDRPAAVTRRADSGGSSGYRRSGIASQGR